jgi:hypothetical protein
MVKNYFLFGLFFIFISTEACTPRIAITKNNEGNKAGANTMIKQNDLYNPDTTFLADLLNGYPAYFGQLVAQPDTYKLEIWYTKIDRDAQNRPSFTHYAYRPFAQYTYPASTVKLPAAVLALEKLNELRIPDLDLHSPMFTEGVRVGEKPVYTDPTARNGKPSIAQYIRKILLVSDNDAHNRLYEWLGQEGFNKRLHQLGFTRAQMTHRLSIALSDAENRVTNPIFFHDKAGNVVYRQPLQQSSFQFSPRSNFIGKAYYNGNHLIQNPMDFSRKNCWPIAYAHQLTQWLFFPESQPEQQRLLLTASDYAFLRRYMGMLPQESKYPAYDTAKYWPAYVKFLLAGSKPGPWPYPNLRIFNKVGNAYGHLLDAAYVVDFDNKIEFLLSATIYCNADEVLNDDKYDYHSVGFPFMQHLGEVIYAYEKKRQRTYKPDLSALQYNFTE